MKSSISTKYRIKKGFITQKDKNIITIFDGGMSSLYKFNKTGSFIFEKIRQRIGENEILDLLVEKYFIRREKANKDLEEFLDEMKKRKIIS